MIIFLYPDEEKPVREDTGDRLQETTTDWNGFCAPKLHTPSLSSLPPLHLPMAAAGGMDAS